MHTDACLSLRRIVIVSVVASLLCGGSAVLADHDESFHLSVSPDPATTGDPLVATITKIAGIPCAHVLDPVVIEESQIVSIGITHLCPPLPPTPFPHHILLGPLPPGIWDIRLTAVDLPVSPPPILDQVSVTVIDPHFSVRLTPSPATEDDMVVAHVVAEATCPVVLPAEIEEGRIRLNLGVLICDPPGPLPFEYDQPLGQLAAGDYVVELFYGDLRVAENTLSVLPAGSCAPGDTNLCLSRGRFRVEATWATLSGLTGPAWAVEETDNSGLFWFRNPDNIELVVKIIDACTWTNPRFWLFAGGATNTGVSIEVTDTETGETASYLNPPGQPFEAILDTDAFLDCP